MRIEAVKREVSSAGTMEVARATIKATPKIFDMFANDTYANKPLAIMRELVANGIDAHVAAGRRDRPVEVVLPTPYDPTCRIRDFGTGMAHDFVMGPFMAYTDGSTKDKSDEAIGGFGIGSKSPFAYVDQYTLRVVHNGVLSVYTMFKDADGIPAVGLQAQTTTDEPNGVEIAFPVEDADMDTFATAAQDALQYFQPLPIVTNGTLNPPEYTYLGNGWAMRPKSGELGIIMGGVRYPAQKSSMAYDLRTDSRVGPLLDYGLDLTMPIGSCSVAMSREQLSYTPKTSDSIKKALEALVDDVIKTFANFFDHCPTEWEAMKLLHSETMIGQGSYTRTGRAQLLLSNAKYKGKTLTTNFRIGPEDYQLHRVKSDDLRAWLVPPSRSRRSSTVPPPKWGSLGELYGIEPGLFESVIVDDLPQSPKSRTIARIKAFVETQPQTGGTLVLRGRDENDLKLLQSMMRGAPCIQASTLPEPPKVVTPKSVRPRVRMFRFNGNSDRYTHQKINNLTPSVSKSNAVSEIPYNDQPSSGIMVVMNSFDLPADFYERMNTKLVSYDELVFVNQADQAKLKNTFLDFEAVFAERLTKTLALYPDLPERLALATHPLFDRWRSVLSVLGSAKAFSRLSPEAKARPFGRMVQLWRKYISELTAEQQRLAPFVTAKLPKGLNLSQLEKDFDTQQGDLKILLQHLRVSTPEHQALLFKNF